MQCFNSVEDKLLTLFHFFLLQLSTELNDMACGSQHEAEKGLCLHLAERNSFISSFNEVRFCVERGSALYDWLNSSNLPRINPSQLIQLN